MPTVVPTDNAAKAGFYSSAESDADAELGYEVTLVKDAIGSFRGPISLPRDVTESLNRPEKQFIPAKNPETLAVIRWKDFLHNLTRDAEAKFPFQEVTDNEQTKLSA
jgi:hypothetical protein